MAPWATVCRQALRPSLLTGRTAFTITGDGDFLMNGQELATAMQHGGKSIIVLLNNGMYGTIRMHQEREYPTRVSGSAAAATPTFAALARAYGYAGVSASRARRNSSRS
jgi:acetolactate synthase-1/2/3 large subunit